MKVKELRKLLNNLDSTHDNFLVVISKDDEGNGFREADLDTEIKFFSKEEEHAYDKSWFEEQGEKVPRKLKACIVLW